MDISSLRRDYQAGGLRRGDLKSDPIDQFTVWFEQASQAQLVEPNAMSLATTTPEAQPTLRTVLLKAFDHSGFVFFTNFESTKARQIEQNPHVALLFPWLALERQVIVLGTAARISAATSLKYFLTRPRESQLGAWVSQQSSVLSSRKILEMKLEEMKRKFADGQVPLPSFWGGYRVTPRSVEFWQGRPNRLHDRFLYTRQGDDTWTIERRAP